MAGSRILWHFAQLLPIVTAGAWAIACIVTLFTVPTEPPQRGPLGSSSSSSTSPTFFPGRRALNPSSSSSGGGFGSSSSFDNSYNSAYAEYRWRRNYMFTLWIGTALGFVFVAVGVSMYVALGLCDKYVRTRVNRMDQWLKRRKIVIAITTVFRVVGALAGIALGAYYASRKDSKLAAAAALGFVFAVACIIAIVFTWIKKIEQPMQSKEAMAQDASAPQYGNGGYGVHNSQAYGAHGVGGHN